MSPRPTVLLVINLDVYGGVETNISVNVAFTPETRLLRLFVFTADPPPHPDPPTGHIQTIGLIMPLMPVLGVTL